MVAGERVQSFAMTQQPADRIDAALRCVDRASFCFDEHGEPLPQTSAPDMIARMLRLLSGREHRVITGVCLVANGQPSVASETTLVTVSEIADKEIAGYVASGEPLDKAGAYAIQGIASRWIPRIEGDYGNVVGLPVALVYAMLRQAGVL